MMKTEEEFNGEEINEYEPGPFYDEESDNNGEEGKFKDVKVNQPIIKRRKARNNNKEKMALKALDRKKQFDDSMLLNIEEKIKNLESQLILTASSEKEIKINKITEKNLIHQRAVREVITTGCSTRAAARKVLDHK